MIKFTDDGELNFWERICVAAASGPADRVDTPVELADEAVQARRERQATVASPATFLGKKCRLLVKQHGYRAGSYWYPNDWAGGYFSCSSKPEGKGNRSRFRDNHLKLVE